MYLLWQQREYSAQTGVVEHRASYPCEHCRRMLHVLVQTHGYGGSTANLDLFGGSVQHQQEAAQRAQASASGFGNRAMATAPCPHCGRLPGAGDRAFAMAETKERWRRRLLLPVPIAAATLTALTQFASAMEELPHSATLLARSLALSLAAAFGALAVVLFFPGGVTARPLARLFFWLPKAAPDAPRGTASESEDEGAEREPVAAKETAEEHAPESFDWWEAPLRSQGRGVAWSGWGIWAALGATVALLLCALVSHNMFEHGFAQIIVATTAPVGTRITIARAGEAAAIFYVSSTERDVFSAEVTVRSSEARDVRVVIEGVSDHTYTLPKAEYGWIIAPPAAIGDLCFAEEVAHYGRRNVPGSTVTPLTMKNDVYLVPARRDLLFQAPPDSISSSGSSDNERRAVRALPCRDLADPQGDGPGPGGPPRR